MFQRFYLVVIVAVDEDVAGVAVEVDSDRINAAEVVVEVGVGEVKLVEVSTGSLKSTHKI